jgi:hypothetical protein
MVFSIGGAENSVNKVGCWWWEDGRYVNGACQKSAAGASGKNIS